MSEKPVIFISHSHKDGKLALRLHDSLALFQVAAKERFFGDEVEIFVSSAPDATRPGDDWLENVLIKLDATDVLVVLLTSLSMNSHWVWFEIGYVWNRKRMNPSVQIYTVYEKNIVLLSPLDRLLGIPMEDEARFKTFLDHVGGDIVRLAIDSRAKRVKNML